MTTVQLIETSGGIADCPGYKIAGVGCDIRETGDPRLDLALLVSESPCSAAGVFTLNDVCAAPVHICKAILTESGNQVAGCVINSGNANACTAAQGDADAVAMAKLSAAAVGAPLRSMTASELRSVRRCGS